MKTTLNPGRQFTISRRSGLTILILSGFVLAITLLANVKVRPTLGRASALATVNAADASAHRPGKDPARPLATGSHDDGSGSPTLDDHPPKLVAESTVYDFGKMDPYSPGEHKFLVHNEGPGPLKLLDHRSTCKCTVGHFTRDAIPAGESTEVTIQWQTQSNSQRFEQSATVETNDPAQPAVTFTITGDVLVHVGANPPEFSLPGVRPGTRESATTIVSSQVWSGFQLRNIRSSLPDLQWAVEPVSEAERQSVRATAAQRLTIQLPDAMPQGPFNHWVRFEVVPDDAEAQPREYELPLRGKILRRLAVYGPGIDNQGNVRLGVIPSTEGLKRRLIMKVYDEDPALPIDAIHVRPDFLKVSVNPHAAEGSDKGLYYLDIEVPSSAPPCLHQDQEAGEITIRFAHPRIPELSLRVHLAVAQQLAEGR